MSEPATIKRENLEALVIANDEFEKLEDAFDRFCPFEAMGVVRAEIRHGVYLSKMLSPSDPHGYGSKLLRALITKAVAGEAVQGITPMDVYLMELEDAEVSHQWIASADAKVRTTQKSGQQRLDILINCPSARFIVAIELKVDAGQSEKQLSTYRSMVSRAFPNYKMLFIFLTKKGDEPDDPDGSWIALTFEDMVAAFERFADLPGAEPAAREMLKSYFVMLRRHHMSDPNLEHYARELWRKHRPALEFLMDRRPDGLGQVLRALCDGAAAIARELQQQGLNVEPETTEGAILRFAIKDWDELPNFHSADSWTKSNRILLLEVTRRRDTMRVFYIIGPGDPETREWIFKALRRDTTLKSNTKLATRWHRIGRENLYKSSDPDEIEVQEVTQECRKKLIGYIKRTVPRMSDLLKAAAPATRGE